MKKIFTILISVFVLFLAGCASTGVNQAKFNQHFDAGEYATCAEMLSKTYFVGEKDITPIKQAVSTRITKHKIKDKKIIIGFL